MSHPLKRYRERRGLSQEEFGRLIGTTKVTISRFETGAREPTLRTIKKIMDVTGGELTANDFMPRHAAPEPMRVAS